QNKTKLRADFEVLMTIGTRNSEATKFRGGSVIRMTFQLSTKCENLQATEWTFAKCIQTMKHSKPDDHATTKATRNGNISGNRGRKWKRPLISGLKESAPGAAGHFPGRKSARPGNRDQVIKSKRDPKAVKAGPEIGGGRGNADRDLLLFQR